jgi:3-oxoadipate enol-lactonase
MQKFTGNNVTLAYDRAGQGAPLILIHGFPLNRSIWEDVKPLLTSTFDLLLPDLRGFGDSVSSAPAWTMADLAADIASLLDHLGIESAFIAGHSMGGYVALAFAQTYPQRVRGLALVSSQTFSDPAERKAGRYAEALHIAEDGIGDTVQAMTAKFSADTGVQKYAHDLMRQQKPAGFIGSLRAMADRADTLSVLVDSTFPILLIHGDADALIPVDRAREIQAKVPRAHLVELAGIGHMPMKESPQAVANALKNLNA